jgi:hypothetical protein
MAYTKYSLTPASNNAAPPDGAPEGMLPSAVNDTMRDMMAQIRDCGDGIRNGTYTMTAPVITGGTITGASLTGNTFTSPVISGGSINNTPIGATTASTGAFTTSSLKGSTSGAVTLAAPAVAGTNTVTIAAQTGTLNAAGPAFRATQTSTTALANVTFTKILFDTEVFDTNSNFSSSRFTPTVEGYYQVTGIVRFSMASGNFTSPYIYKNGSPYQGEEGCVQSATNDISGIVTSLVYCNGSTDYIEFYGYQSSGGSKNTVTGTTNTSFTGFLVRGA